MSESMTMEITTAVDIERIEVKVGGLNFISPGCDLELGRCFVDSANADYD
jgi:hypothetical protein